MNDTTEKSYEDLAIESSNLILLGDSRRALGRDNESVDSYQRAGDLRRAMGDAKKRVGDLESAAEDWLSAVACYLKSHKLDLARDVVAMVRKLCDADLLQAARKDLVEALREREAEVDQYAATQNARVR